MRRYIIYIEKSCKLFKSPKTGRASKYKESNSPKTNKEFFKKKKYIYIYIYIFFFFTKGQHNQAWGALSSSLLASGSSPVEAAT